MSRQMWPLPEYPVEHTQSLSVTVSVHWAVFSTPSVQRQAQLQDIPAVAKIKITWININVFLQFSKCLSCSCPDDLIKHCPVYPIFIV